MFHSALNSLYFCFCHTVRIFIFFILNTYSIVVFELFTVKMRSCLSSLFVFLVVIVFLNFQQSNASQARPPPKDRKRQLNPKAPSELSRHRDSFRKDSFTRFHRRTSGDIGTVRGSIPDLRSPVPVLSDESEGDSSNPSRRHSVSSRRSSVSTRRDSGVSTESISPTNGKGHRLKKGFN